MKHNIQYKVSIVPNKFYHVAATCDSVARTMKLYLDGSLLGNYRLPSKPMAESTIPMIIGAYCLSQSCDVARDFFRGIIDEVTIFNGVLGDQEISDLARK